MIMSNSTYWAWPIPDPRWDSTHPNEFIATYSDASTPELMYRLRQSDGKVLNVITGLDVGTQVSGGVGVWWNKPD